MSHPPNPLQDTHPTTPPPVSSTTFLIAGIPTTVYGLSSLSADTQSLSCLWLLHPRGGSHEAMRPLAALCITHWNARRASEQSPRARGTGLIAVTFDQRNHGGRLVDEHANDTWRAGNRRHAQDMFGVYRKPIKDPNRKKKENLVLRDTKLIDYIFSRRGHRTRHLRPDNPPPVVPPPRHAPHHDPPGRRRVPRRTRRMAHAGA